MTHREPIGLEMAEHFAALHDADAPPEAIDAALAWIDEDPVNRAAYRRMVRFRHSCDEINALLSRDEVLSEFELSGQQQQSWLKRSWLGLLAIAATLAIGVLVFTLWVGLGASDSNARMQYATAVGETRTVRLPDGSFAELGGSSGISVAYSGDRRSITLTDGEAFFRVAHDTTRPFVVTAGAGTVQAVGTRFSVQRSSRDVLVAVEEGKVRVTADRRAAYLPAGRQISVASDGVLSPAASIDVGQVASWRRGVLQYRNRTLNEVVADLNRYSRKPIILSGPEIGTERISGTVRIERMNDWLQGVAAASGFTLINHKQGAIVLCEPGNCGSQGS